MTEIAPKVKFLYYVLLGAWPHDIQEEIAMCSVAANYGLYGMKRKIEASPEYVKKILDGIVYDMIRHGQPLSQYCWAKRK